MALNGMHAPFVRRCAAFLLLIGTLWLAFYAMDRSLPFVRPGHEQIYDLAKDTVANGTVFPGEGDRTHVAVFGDSRVQAGFIPDVFDQESGGTAYSFNLGLPDQGASVEEIRTLVRRGQTPDVVALTIPWDSEAPASGWTRLTDDRFVLEQLFPFRQFPRNITLFLLRSLSRGGPAAYYDSSRRYVDQARRARGYFFIEGMSHFPDHRLPDDFRADTDDPSVPMNREVTPAGPAFEELLALQASAGFRTVFVPTYYRIGAWAPPEANDPLAERLRVHGIEVLGPDYWLYPNRLFSDPGHLNPAGAEVYTRDLWRVLSPVVGVAARAGDPPGA